MVRVRVLRDRSRAQRPGGFHVVLVRAGVLSLCHGVEQRQCRRGDAGRSADGRGRDSRYRRAIRQLEHLLHRSVRPPQDMALVR